jgi:hypothetical protein
MKPVACLIVAALCFGGCRSVEPVTLEPVGPRPLRQAMAVPPGGFLVVYSALDAAPGTAENDSWTYSNYQLCDANGQRLQWIRNQSDQVAPDPAHIRLSPGRYSIVARSAEGRQTTVPVVIEEDRTTYVRLDGTPMPEIADAHFGGVVRSPEGAAVGWRAEHAAERN